MHFAFNMQKKQDYKIFYDTEIHIRKQLRYPPFCDIMLIGISDKYYKNVESVSKSIYEDIKSKNKNSKSSNNII